MAEVLSIVGVALGSVSLLLAVAVAWWQKRSAGDLEEEISQIQSANILTTELILASNRGALGPVGAGMMKAYIPGFEDDPITWDVVHLLDELFKSRRSRKPLRLSNISDWHAEGVYANPMHSVEEARGKGLVEVNGDEVKLTHRGELMHRAVRSMQAWKPPLESGK